MRKVSRTWVSYGRVTSSVGSSEAARSCWSSARRPRPTTRPGARTSGDSIAGNRGRPRGLILLRETRGRGAADRGIAGLGDTPEETATSLCMMFNGFQPSEVIACGTGLGGHAVLVFGALLYATRVVAVEPVAHLIAQELASYNDRRWRGVLEDAPRIAAAARFRRPGCDPAAPGSPATPSSCSARVGATAPPRPAHHNLIHAHWLACFPPGAALCLFPDIWQGLWGELHRRGQLEAVLEQYLFDEECCAAIVASRRDSPGYDPRGPAS